MTFTGEEHCRKSSFPVLFFDGESALTTGHGDIKKRDGNLKKKDGDGRNQDDQSGFI